MRSKLTIDTAKSMEFTDLVEEADRIVEHYAPPSIETEPERVQRLSKTLDELPDVYRWFLTLQSYFDHWTDAQGHITGLRSIEYKQLRQRRDAMERAANFAKRRYEGASRLLTLIDQQQGNHMPRGRG
jgi:hypothetical protein